MGDHGNCALKKRHQINTSWIFVFFGGGGGRLETGRPLETKMMLASWHVISPRTKITTTTQNQLLVFGSFMQFGPSFGWSTGCMCTFNLFPSCFNMQILYCTYKQYCSSSEAHFTCLYSWWCSLSNLNYSAHFSGNFVEQNCLSKNKQSRKLSISYAFYKGWRSGNLTILQYFFQTFNK